MLTFFLVTFSLSALVQSEALKPCLKLYRPVCGSDGNTYNNKCLANKAGVAVAEEGVCRIEAAVCPFIWDPVCGVDGKTYPSPCDAKEIAHVEIKHKGDCRNAPKFTGSKSEIHPACPRIYAPVCGADGKTYNNECLAVKGGKVPVVHHGECRGGTQILTRVRSKSKYPPVCPRIYAPVCGADGKTYSNECLAIEGGKVPVVHEGECKS